MGKTEVGVARKSAPRVHAVDMIMACLRQESIYKTLDYRNKSEAYIKEYMHQPLQGTVREILRFLQPDVQETTISRKARGALLWEGDVTTTVNNIRFLGVQHRPDFVVKVGGMRIAVEVKRGETGSAVREGIGQSLAYAGCGDFDFVTYLFIDTSRDKKIAESTHRDATAEAFIESLWRHYN
ncbi:MAG TPA: hypothetical protein VFH61_02815, partial [Thermoleophilia bacterium]|nr:hypothetical protein [Thermoleophilia bacterium]